MRHCRLILALAVMALTLPVARGEFTLERCKELARENYPAVARLGIIEATKGYDLSNAAKSWLPQVGVTAQGAWQNEVMKLPEILTGILASQGMDYPGIKQWQYKAGVDVTQQIWDGGRVSARRSVAESEAEVSLKSTENQLYEVEARVEQIYFGILLIDRRIECNRLTSELMDSTLARVKSLVANGVAMRSDADEVEASRLSMSQQRVQLDAMRRGYMAMMQIFTGEDFSGEKPAIPAESGARESAWNHPQLSVFEARQRELESRRKMLDAGLRPTLGAFLSGYYGYPRLNYFKSMQSENPAFTFMAGVKLSWNIGALYTRGNDIRKLEKAAGSVAVDREVFEFNNRLENVKLENDIASLRELLDSDRRMVELRRSVRMAAESKLRNGVIDTTDLLTKITDEQLAEVALATREIEMLQNVYQLNYNINK